MDPIKKEQKKIETYRSKIQNGEFDESQLPDLIEYISSPTYLLMHLMDKSLDEALCNIEPMLCKYLNVTPGHICYETIDNNNIEKYADVECVFGNVDLPKQFITKPTLSNLKIVFGDINLDGSKCDSLDNLETITGNALLLFAKIESMPKLKTVGIDAVFAYSKLKNVDNLQFVGGDVMLHGTTNLKLKNVSIGGRQLESYENSEQEQIKTKKVQTFGEN